MHKECCLTCNKKFDLIKFDYSGQGCNHIQQEEGFVCMALANEGDAIWMVGNNPSLEICEEYSPIK